MDHAAEARDRFLQRDFGLQLEATGNKPTVHSMLSRLSVLCSADKPKRTKDRCGRHRR